MKIQLIRNATMKITMAGKTILTDPVFSPKHGIESFAGIEKNPIVDLPLPINEIMDGIDMVLISHLHQDHFDAAAKSSLPKNIKIICQPSDKNNITKQGFTNVVPLEKSKEIEGIMITRTPGKHADNDKWNTILGPISGFIFTAVKEPLVYWAGDTILNEEVEKTINDHKPNIILTHSCGAVLEDSGFIVMDAEQTVKTCKIAPWARVVAIHLEALDHGTTTRKDIKRLAAKENIPSAQLLIPDDGQTIDF